MSNYSEVEILKVAIKLLEENGQMTTTELKEALRDEMKPSMDDLKINVNRNDTKFDQKVRNMISHRETNDLLVYCTYERKGNNGLLTSKSILSGNPKSEDARVNEEQTKRSNERKEKKKAFIARKIDFEAINKRNKEIGEYGEEFVLAYEKQRLPQELSDKVRHISKEDGDGAGYDILSYTTEGKVRFLEVKTTTGPLDTPFYLSENERIFLEVYKEEVEIIRVYNFDQVSKTGKIHRISGKAFYEEVNLQARGYQATLKKFE